MSQAQQPEALAAIKTLQSLGYTYQGAELWKPPIGQAPDFNLIDQLHARIAELEDERTARMTQNTRMAERIAELETLLQAEHQDIANGMAALAKLKADPAATLTDEQIDAAFERMPDGVQGFLKSWGYRQFARAIEALCAAPAPAAVAVPDGWHKAVLDACMVTEACYVEADPAASVRNLIDWHASVAVEAAALAATPPAQAQQIGALVAAAKSGDMKAIELAAQLVGAQPCGTCGYVHTHCRCAPPQAQDVQRVPCKPIHPKGMTSINARLAFNQGWVSSERHHGIRAADIAQAVAGDAAQGEA